MQCKWVEILKDSWYEPNAKYFFSTTILGTKWTFPKLTNSLNSNCFFFSGGTETPDPPPLDLFVDHAGDRCCRRDRHQLRPPHRRCYTGCPSLQRMPLAILLHLLATLSQRPAVHGKEAAAMVRTFETLQDWSTWERKLSPFVSLAIMELRKMTQFYVQSPKPF